MICEDGEACGCGAAPATKTCAFCAMQIPAAATICGHCRKPATTLGMVGEGMQGCGMVGTLLITIPAVLIVLALLGLRAC